MDKLAEEQLREIIKSCVEEIWHGRRSLNLIKEQTDLLMERLVPILELTHEAKLKEELIKFAKWFNKSDEPLIKSTIDEYLKQHNK